MQLLVATQPKSLSLEMKKTKVLYLMGAGRSGTTALATLLNASPDLISLGELHHTPYFVAGDKQCSCGEMLSSCSFWKTYIDQLKAFTNESYIAEQAALESHLSVFKYSNKKYGQNTLAYQAANSDLLNSCSQDGKLVILDSAKYVGRALALSRNPDIDLRVIYMTRDPRGVVSSFAKNVQTPKGTLSACLYYNAINFLSLLASRFFLKNRILKIRYEDLSDNYKKILDQISEFCEIDCKEIIDRLDKNVSFEVGHIIGGNRLKSSGKIRFQADDGWRNKISRLKRYFVYVFTLPFCLINNYKL